MSCSAEIDPVDERRQGILDGDAVKRVGPDQGGRHSEANRLVGPIGEGVGSTQGPVQDAGRHRASNLGGGDLACGPQTENEAARRGRVRGRHEVGVAVHLGVGADQQPIHEPAVEQPVEGTLGSAQRHALDMADGQGPASLLQRGVDDRCRQLHAIGGRGGSRRGRLAASGARR